MDGDLSKGLSKAHVSAMRVNAINSTVPANSCYFLDAL